MSNREIKILIEKFKKGDLRALSRLISLCENKDPNALEPLSKLFIKSGHAKIYGITGPPGAGKSSLLNHFIHKLREEKKRVAVIAVDPTSPFTGGSLLGDRIRLSEHFNDPDVYIRSLSTRGKLGGLSLATQEAVALLDAFGFDVILIETVGVGQSEVDIKNIAQVTLVVLVPESGDAVQALKAGILEIGDVFVVNKAEREGSEKVVRELKQILELSHKDPSFVLSSTALDSFSAKKVFIELEKIWEKNKKHILTKRKNTKLEITRSWVEDHLAREVIHWIKKNEKKIKNPYEWILKFQKKYPKGKLLR